MDVYVDQDRCINCGICMDISDFFYENDDEKADCRPEDIDDADFDEIADAVVSCPTNAIVKH